MLLKMIGSFLIILASSYIGYSYSKGLGLRVDSLNDFRSLVCELQNEIEFKHSCIADVFSQLANKWKKPVSRVFLETLSNMNEEKMEFGLSWEVALRNEQPRLKIEDGDVEMLGDFGKMLGQSDIDGENANFKLTVQRLDGLIEEAKEQQKRFSNIFLFSGAGVGIVIILLLV